MPAKLDEGFCVYGAGVIAKHLEALRGEIPGVREAQDIEYVHRTRVATRRLRSALPLFAACFPEKRYRGWLKGIRGITRALGAARDTDVQIEELNRFRAGNTDPLAQAGLRRLLLRLQQRRQHAQEEVLAALDELESGRVLDELGNSLSGLLAQQGQVYPYTPYLYQQAYEAIQARLAEIQAYEPYVDHPECMEELHAMRIAAKRLRYTLEVFAPIYPGSLKTYLQVVRRVQETLGELHDCDVWILWIPEFTAQERALTQQYFGHLRTFRRLLPGLESFLRNRQEARVGHYEDFHATWQKTREQGLWAELVETIRIPFFRGEQPARPEHPLPAEEPAPAAPPAETEQPV